MVFPVVPHQGGGGGTLVGHAFGGQNAGMPLLGGGRRGRKQRGGVNMSELLKNLTATATGTAKQAGGGRSRRLRRHSGKARHHRTKTYSAGGRRRTSKKTRKHRKTKRHH